MAKTGADPAQPAKGTPMTILRRLFLTSLTLALALWASLTLAQSNYVVRAGDVLRIEVIEDPELNRSVLVAPDGRISVPLAGGVRAAGRTLEQIQSTLVGQLAPNFAAPPTVFVGLGALAEEREQPEPEPEVVQIFVIGEAANKGRIALEPGTTLLQAIAQFGGFTNFAATRRIQLRRGTKIYTINYDAILAGTSPNGDVVMREDDIIIAPQRRLFE